mmetsp:Transcript_4490/g.9322  ORF Transcript_4490/g.9322 Transcript_4490/m.9322 type:complete len:204 (+) Transcript_4490:138-749(+)
MFLVNIQNAVPQPFARLSCPPSPSLRKGGRPDSGLRPMPLPCILGSRHSTGCGCRVPSTNSRRNPSGPPVFAPRWGSNSWNSASMLGMAGKGAGNGAWGTLTIAAPTTCSIPAPGRVCCRSLPRCCHRCCYCCCLPWIESAVGASMEIFVAKNSCQRTTLTLTLTFTTGIRTAAEDIVVASQCCVFVSACLPACLILPNSMIR